MIGRRNCRLFHSLSTKERTVSLTGRIHPYFLHIDLPRVEDIHLQDINHNWYATRRPTLYTLALKVNKLLAIII